MGCPESCRCHTAAGTFPGTFYHASLFFSTKELNLGFATVTTATAVSQARVPQPQGLRAQLPGCTGAHACGRRCAMDSVRCYTMRVSHQMHGLRTEAHA